MRNIIMLFTTFISTAAVAVEEPAIVLKKPLIIGASVSADWNSMSPGKKLALRYTKPSEIKMQAQGGRPGRETVNLLKDGDFKDRTIIVGIDLFFWDSVHGSLDQSLKALESIMKHATSRNLPIVLGEIPELLPGRQPHRNRLNKEIAKACESYSRCYVMPFDQLLKQLLREGGIEMYGRKYTLSEIVPDGLHLVETAGNFLADVMLEVLQGKRS